MHGLGDHRSAQKASVMCCGFACLKLLVAFAFTPRKFDFVVLRAGLQAAAAADALGERINRLLLLGRLPRPRSCIVIAVDGHPAFDLF